ncbi:hypothetical protein DFH09DRAFT_1329917 [Mycena vulgaris]|nr:hypothetical protein DFH09DRAFT_1329917 [Mycena vulgaris]
MPLFNNSTGFQIHGGNFYEVSGDVNLDTHQHLTTMQEQRLLDAVVGPSMSSTLALDDGWAEGSGRGLPGIARNPRHGMAARQAPYGLLILTTAQNRRRVGRRAQRDAKFPISERIHWAPSLTTEVLWIAFEPNDHHHLSMAERSSLRRT